MQFHKTEILRDREKAVLVWFAKVSREDWVPKSALMPGSIRSIGQRGLLIIQDWKGRELVDKLGLEEPTYTDAYNHGFSDGHARGLREGSGAAARDWAQRNANEPDLTKARSIYRKLVAKWHPDRDGGNEDVMKGINELWQAVNRR